MPIRNPLYLDGELVRNVADYVGIPTVDVAFQEKDSTSRAGKAGVNIHALQAGGSLQGGNETQRTYEVRVTPVRLMNDAIDAALNEDIVKGPDGPVLRRDLVELDGVLELTLTSEFGQILGLVLPTWQPGTDLDAQAITRAVLSGDAKPASDQLFELTETGWEQSVYVSVSPGAFVGERGPDDLAREVTVFATVDRLIPAGGQLPLESWLFPGANRIVRRTLANGQNLDNVVNSLSAALGRTGDVDYRVHGPALLLRPIAIY